MTSERLTPVMQLMVSEGLLDLPSASALAKRLTQRFMREIFDQLLYTIKSYPYEGHAGASAGDAFRVTLGPTLDPFSETGKCEELACRVSTAQRFARSIPLYVDQAIVPDPIEAILFQEQPPTISRLAEELQPRLAVLKTLMPLIDAGVVRFAASAHAVCAHCKSERDRLTQRGLDYCRQLLIESGLQIEIERRRDGKGGRIVLSCPRLLGTGPHDLRHVMYLNKERMKRFAKYFGERTKRGKITRGDGEILERQIRAFVSFLVGHVVFDMNTAAMSRSAFAAGSTLETAFLASLESTAPPTSEIQKWEALRSIELPWVRDLSVQQIVQLRHDAGPALEHFRASMAGRINQPGRSDQSVVETFVSDLRLQAVEVQNELMNYRKFGGRGGHVAFGRASLAFVLYGLLMDASTATAAIAAALTALATLHPPATQRRMETERLRARAPYVLVRAREILAHQGPRRSRG
jgi:hypothetical protein